MYKEHFDFSRQKPVQHTGKRECKNLKKLRYSALNLDK